MNLFSLHYLRSESSASFLLFQSFFIFLFGIWEECCLCPDSDWHEFGEFCYRPFDVKKTWYDARSECRKLGADLVSIMCNNYKAPPVLCVTVLLCVTGSDMSSVVCSADYLWSDGSALSHTNWGPGEPNDHAGRENCVELVTTQNGSSYWNDIFCDIKANWSYARDWCRSQQGDLAVIDDINENGK
uniref:Macrophage mannose receptor 1-like n=1 Tax=Astyanax mexicanus TaxID=7994 RepID=A0A3B1IFE8_ASTMX